MTQPRHGSTLRTEWFLAVSVGAAALFLFFGNSIWSQLHHWPVLVLAFGSLFAAVLGSALSVIRHAEHLADMLGDPFGTLILTFSVIVIEITSITSVMLHGDANPTLARDTLFAVVMIILNGMVGLTLLIGGWRHGEQFHNLQGANVYLCASIPLLVFGLVMPDFTLSTSGPTLSRSQQIFLILASVGIYLIFLRLQTGRLRTYFSSESIEVTEERLAASRKDVLRSAALLVAYLVPALILEHEMSHPIDHLTETLGAPPAIGGVFIAVLVAMPEAIGAVRAALHNQLQRAVNIFLGSVLSTIGLTIPAMIVIGEMTGQQLILGVQHTDLVLLLLTIAVSIVTFSSGRTNVLQGAVHLMIFFAYLLFIFQD